ncbi:MAG: carbohydrate ABC transporter permease [Anaerolineales bacterium]
MPVKSREEIIFQVLVNGFLILVLLIILLPLWRVVMMSVEPLGYSAEDSSFGMLIPPWRWSFNAYAQLTGHPSFIKAVWNSLQITVLGTALSLFLTVPLAYVLSIRTLPGRNILINFILLTYLFSAGMVPTYLVVHKLGLIDHLAAVFLPVAIGVYNVLIMKGFFEGLPVELQEAARLDGASELQVLVQVILPLSKPILLTIGLFYAVFFWNEFFYPILYLNSNNLMPLPVLLRNILMASSMNEYVEFDAFSAAPVESLKAASVFITMLPMVIAYPFIQRYFTKSTLTGSVKQ